MVRPALLAIGLASLLVLAGCSGFGGPSETSPSPTVSPADVPTDRTQATTPQNQLAPGVLPSGVYNASALADAHNRELTNTTFAIRTNVTMTYPNGTVVSSYRSVSRVDTTRPIRGFVQTRYQKVPAYAQRDSSTLVMIETWCGPNVSLWRYTFANNTTAIEERHRQASTRPTQYQTGAELIETNLGNVSSTVQRVGERNGSVLYRINAPISPGSYISLPDNTTVNTSQTLLVDEHGLVRKQQLRYPVEGQNGTTNIGRVNITYHSIGTTSVDRPAWVKQWNSTNSTNSTLTRNESATENEPSTDTDESVLIPPERSSLSLPLVFTLSL